MRCLSNEKFVTKMSSKNIPAIYIEEKEHLLVRTSDCFQGCLRREDDVLSLLEKESINPCSGPIYVRGAEQGDILKVQIHEITIDDHGIVLMDKIDLQKYGIEEKEKSLHLRVDERGIEIADDLWIPAEPMIGVIGTAPLEEDVFTTLPGPHGGNMDSKCIKKGSIVYLPVFHPGGLLALGDIHAAMADGEAGGSGVEISGSIEISVEIIKNSDIPIPFVEVDDKIITIASAETLEKAANESVRMMLHYLIVQKKMSDDLAWKLVAMLADVCVCQFANELKTIRCELSQKYVENFF